MLVEESDSYDSEDKACEMLINLSRKADKLEVYHECVVEEEKDAIEEADEEEGTEFLLGLYGEVENFCTTDPYDGQSKCSYICITVKMRGIRNCLCDALGRQCCVIVMYCKQKTSCIQPNKQIAPNVFQY